MIYFLLVKSN